MRWLGEYAGESIGEGRFVCIITWKLLEMNGISTGFAKTLTFNMVPTVVYINIAAYNLTKRW